ncbi:MAG: hypothetical protein FWE86_00170 [Oscillospiraceae bacterium]|nr:hypothetical protein [Oscillospiraceae bacterium]
MIHKYKARGFVIAVIMAALLLFCGSCSSDNNIEPDSQAYAYLEVFKSMTVGVVNDEIDIGVNLTDVIYEHPSHIKKLINDYAKERNISIVWNIKKGNYNSFEFKKGYLVIFEDVELTETKLKTDVTQMLAPALASSGFTCTVEKEAGEWTITEHEFTWMS